MPRMLCNGNGAISHLQTEMGFLRTSITAYTIDENTFSAPFGIFYVKTENLKTQISKNPIKPPNRVLQI